jgi:flagellar biosynthetic protein FlhB
MSENTPAQEKTEQPTPKRLLDARKKGQVPRSRELNTMTVMLVGAAAMLLLGGWMLQGLQVVMIEGLGSAGQLGSAAGEPVAALSGAIRDGVLLVLPLMLILMIAAVAGPAVLGGAVFSAEAARPKLERLSIPKGLKRIFSAQGLMELVKTLLKFMVLTGISMTMLWQLSGELLGLGAGSPERGMAEVARMVQLAFLTLAFGLVLIAAIDVPFQLWNHFKQLRMTRQEVKDELKQTEGNPDVRGRIRRMQYEAASRRMMDEVPLADVVITNPTHYAIALRYTDRPDRAPRVVAMGKDLVAARIRELAKEHRVPLCAAPPLARALFFNCRLGDEIPAALYLAVARVLAWVMQVKSARETGVKAPALPQALPVPDEMAQPRRTRK